MDPRIWAPLSKPLDPRTVEPRLVGHAQDPKRAQAEAHPGGEQQDPAQKRMKTEQSVWRLLTMQSQEVQAYSRQIETFSKKQGVRKREWEKVLIKLTGLTFADFDREHRLFKQIQEQFRYHANDCRDIRSLDQRVLDTLARTAATPLQRLMTDIKQKDMEMHLNFGNVTEVVEGFAFLGAGGREKEDDGTVTVGGMCLHENTSDERKHKLRQWYKENKVFYILNLAGAEAEMQNAGYPLDEGVMVDVACDSSDASDAYDITEDPDDDLVRILKLPMVDNTDDEKGKTLDVLGSWELREAAKFLERAWRRHRRAQFKCMEYELGCAETGPKPPTILPKLPTILVHCIGGINRSPLSLIYWMLTYHFADKMEPYELWDWTKQKRSFAFQRPDQRDSVLFQKDPWKQGIKDRYESERQGIRAADLTHMGLPMGFPEMARSYRKKVCYKDGRYLSQKQKSMREEAEQPGKLKMIGMYCGGLMGSPVMDDEGDDIDDGES